MSNWQPIETAPKDGTWVWLYDPDDEYEHMGAFVEFQATEDHPLMKHWGGIYMGMDFLSWMNPTHWMPRPHTCPLVNCLKQGVPHEHAIGGPSTALKPPK